MTDRQFDSYQAGLLEILELALRESPDNEILKSLVERIRGELKSP